MMRMSPGWKDGRYRQLHVRLQKHYLLARRALEGVKWV